jgi:hypothetical protein
MRQGGFRNVGGLAQRLASGMAVRGAKEGRGTSVVRLRADWPAIVGPQLARSTQPEALLPSRHGKSGGRTLRLKVSGAAALEVQHQTAQLIERVNAHLGHRAIDDIRLVQGVIVQPPVRRVPVRPDPATLSAMEARVADVKDPELRAALARLGARVGMSRRGFVLAALAAAVPMSELRAQAPANPAIPPALQITARDHVLGQAAAPITIVEYASLSCWGCARFHTETLPPIRQRWIQSGRAKLVFRNFPLDGVATRAGHLVECLRGDKFFAAVDALFRTQDQWSRAPDPFLAAAQAAGLSPSDAKACQINGQPLEKVLTDVQSGQALGVTSTPTLFINGQNHGNPGDPEAVEAILRKVR